MDIELYQTFFVSDHWSVNLVNYTDGKSSGDRPNCLAIFITRTVKTYLTTGYWGFSSSDIQAVSSAAMS